jgi:hypothetical protein
MTMEVSPVPLDTGEIENSVPLKAWTQDRTIATLGTNNGADELAFQSWFRFKEAFTPEVVARAFRETPRPIRRVTDPFGGSGTTALTAQFLGAHAVTIEVNPFLADLIEAKIATYDFDVLTKSFAKVMIAARGQSENPRAYFKGAPPTFVEPGQADRFVFSQAMASRICAFRQAIDELTDETSRRLLRVILGAVLVPVSNVRVSGKGRRYRGGWRNRVRLADEVDQLFERLALSAIFDLRRFGSRSCLSYDIRRGDARQLAGEIEDIDLAIFSPPYPNSFDYTDVYNVELWTLGYLTDADDNASLRKSTLRSHVQIKRDFSSTCRDRSVQEVVDRLSSQKDRLWNGNIPEMVGAYFGDMKAVIQAVAGNLAPRGRLYMVVGDSSYAGIDVPVASILSKVGEESGLTLIAAEPCREMRLSPQQGGHKGLLESLLIFQN